MWCWLHWHLWPELSVFLWLRLCFPWALSPTIIKMSLFPRHEFVMETLFSLTLLLFVWDNCLQDSKQQGHVFIGSNIELLFEQPQQPIQWKLLEVETWLLPPYQLISTSVCVWMHEPVCVFVLHRSMCWTSLYSINSWAAANVLAQCCLMTGVLIWGQHSRTHRLLHGEVKTGHKQLLWLRSNHTVHLLLHHFSVDSE